MNEIITIEQRDGELYADSRMVARVLGVQHQNIRELVQDKEFTLGKVRFETGAKEGSATGQVEKYALLTERQSLLLVTMVRNTTEALEAKAALVDAFMAMHKKLSERPTGSNLLALAVIEAQAMLEAKDKQILEMKPKAEFYDTVAGSKDAIRMGQAAKVLDYPGMGRNNLFQFLRDHGVLQANNLPYQAHVDAGYFRVVLQEYQTPDGETHTTTTTLVYPRGLEFIKRKLESHGIQPRGAA